MRQQFLNGDRGSASLILRNRKSGRLEGRAPRLGAETSYAIPCTQAGEAQKARGPTCEPITDLWRQHQRRLWLGLCGRRAGAGLTSIGGGSGAICVLRKRRACEWRTWRCGSGLRRLRCRRNPDVSLGFGGGARRGSRPGIGTSVSDGSGTGSGDDQGRQRGGRRRRLAALDRVQPARLAIDRAHREPGRQRREIDGAVEPVRGDPPRTTGSPAARPKVRS